MPAARKHLAIAAAAALLLVGAPARALDKDKPAPDFELKNAGGEAVSLSSLRGKVVLLDFWASWCEPCKKELPLLAALAKKLKPRGVEVLAVNIDEKRANAEQFLKAHKVVLEVLFDEGGKVAAARYDPPTMPTSFVIDADGVVRHVNSGFEPGDEKKLEKQLTSLAK
jgi:peroxiredoxin